MLAIVVAVRTSSWVFEHQGDLTSFAACRQAADQVAVAEATNDFLAQLETES